MSSLLNLHNSLHYKLTSNPTQPNTTDYISIKIPWHSSSSLLSPSSYKELLVPNFHDRQHPYTQHLISFFTNINSSLVDTGELICEELPTDLCSFSIASSGKRCLLENCASTDGTTELQCKTSEVVVDGMSAWIETEQCIHACGVDRNSIGISSDSLLDPQFTAQLCSLACYQNCPNIIDLYFNLVSAEGKITHDFIH